MSERDPLSMSTDNTAEGEMYSDTVEGGPISKVMIGDSVVDSTGKEIGTVKFVKMGDPTAVTDEGQEDRRPGILGLGGDSMTWATFPSRLASSSCGSASSTSTCHWRDDRFAGAGQIARVEDNTVYLYVPEADLL